ncbi:MAG: zinc ribbon domain-containing protein [Dehalococcoidia bacterium]|jgi:putative FmdB family regulatory protein|nr:zinc ribbon domain-containing protein [Dehalococcoidia bacterium]
MPIYEYRCRECQEKTSKLWRGFDAPDAVPCAECGSEQTSRIISSVAFHKSLRSKLQDLDPRYDRMVDSAAANTSTSDPNQFIDRATPLSESDA